MSLFRRAADRLADFLYAGRKVSLHFTADYRIARFTLPLIKRLITDDEDGETYRCSIAQWTIDERPPLHVHRGEVSSLRIDGPLQTAGMTYLPLGGLIESPGVTAHLDPVEADRLDRRVREAIEQTICDWVAEHGLYDQPRQRREIDRPKADREAHAAIARWVAEQSANRAATTQPDGSNQPDDCCSGDPGDDLCKGCKEGSDHA